VEALRGGWSLPIAIFDLKSNSYEELPKTEAWIFSHVARQRGLFHQRPRWLDEPLQLRPGSKQTKKLTDYKEYDIKWPSLGPDAIVYENGGVLYEYNLASARRATSPSRSTPKISKHGRNSRPLPKISAVTEFLLPRHASL